MLVDGLCDSRAAFEVENVTLKNLVISLFCLIGKSQNPESQTKLQDELP